MTALLHHAQTLAVDVVRLCVWLVLLAVVFVPLERAFSLRARTTKRRWLGDLGFYFVNSLLPAAVLALPLGLIAAGTRAVLPDGYLAAVAALPLWLQLILGLIVGEVGAYWGHRWSHASPFLWRFHAVHHAAEHLDWLVNTRSHPVDMIFSRLCGLVPIYALGLANPAIDRTAIVPLVVTLVGTVWTFFIHANVRWRFGPLEWLVATPAFHHWHHTNDHNRDRNFASLLPAVDRVFGTAHLPKREWPPCYGIDAPPEPLFRRRRVTPSDATRS